MLQLFIYEGRNNRPKRLNLLSTSYFCWIKSTLLKFSDQTQEYYYFVNKPIYDVLLLFMDICYALNMLKGQIRQFGIIQYYILHENK